MKPRTMVRLATTFAACAVAFAASAHHSHPYTYDQCRSIAIEGRVESVEWKEPHTQVVVRLDDGAAYTVDWNSVQGLTRSGLIGPAQAALVPGVRIAVTGNPIRSAAEIRKQFPEFTREVDPRTVDPISIRRVGDSWSWTRSAGDAMPGELPPGCGKK